MQTTLVLEDGTEFPGHSFGALAPTPAELSGTRDSLSGIGEVVFNTAMSGYHEVLTDPSYTGQLVAMTYPHIGNYGCLAEWDEAGPETGRSGAQIRVVKPAGLIVRSVYGGPVPDGTVTLDSFLKDAGIPGISDIDTRRLTLHLRDNGAQNGVIVTLPVDAAGTPPGDRTQVREILTAFPSMEGRSLVGHVGALESTVVNPHGAPHVALLDCGLKGNILRQLVMRNCRITVLPSDTSPETLAAMHPDALFVSNGPGDPGVLTGQVELIRSVLDSMPVLGICLGHQLVAEAIGAKTYKMPFGHHGVNHPVQDESTRQVFVTSQNHGFAVREESLPPGCSVWFRNANDQTVEGITDLKRRIMTTQFHPESAPGPDDALWIFDSFVQAVTE